MDRWTPSTMPRWARFKGQGSTTDWRGQMDGHVQGERLNSTLNETQGVGEDGQMDTINHAKMG